MFRGVCQRERWGPIESIRVGRFNFGVNTSFVVHRLGSTVIEAGPPNRWRQIGQFLSESRVETLLVSHHHEDHSGNAARIGEWGARVLAPEASLRLLHQGFPIHFYRRQVWGVPPRVDAEALPDDFLDADQRRWKVIATPGHADDMVCFLELEHGWLFSADLYVAARVRFARPEDRLPLEIASLKRVLSLPFSELFCAHRGRVERGRQALEAKLDYLVTLREQVRDLFQRGWSLGRIRRRLLGFEDHVSWLSGFHFCKANLIRACLQ